MKINILRLVLFITVISIVFSLNKKDSNDSSRKFLNNNNNRDVIYYYYIRIFYLSLDCKSRRKQSDNFFFTNRY